MDTNLNLIINMKNIITKLLAVIAILSLGLFSGCHTVEDEITEMNLSRCLEPMNLTAKVTNGDQVTFGWDLTSGADKYGLEIYSDDKSTLVNSVELNAGDIPYTIKLEADASYYYRVQARTTLVGKDYSNWVNYGKVIETYAVKSNLYIKVAERTNSSLSFTWTADPEVDRLVYEVTGSDNANTKTLTSSEIAAGAATISGLSATTNYVVTLYFKSANRGEINVWTRPNTGDAFPVSDVAAFKAAVAAKEVKVLLKAAGSPYDLGETGLDIPAGIEIYGEESIDGSRPVIKGELSIPDTFEGGKIYLESIEMNGVKNTYGFAIQLKNGGKAANLPIDGIVYKNCNITGYSKGLIYEWGQTMVLEELTYNGCTIYEINADGTNGGDVIDFRNATTIGALNIINNTIYTGFRTFIRLDANVTAAEILVKNNTIMNICFIDNTNNSGFFGIKSTTKPSSLVFSNNLVLYETGSASIVNTNEKNLADITFSNNYYYGCVTSFFERVTTTAATAGGGKVLSEDPCYNAKGGMFNLTNPDVSVAQAGAPIWFTPYVEEPEDLTLPLTETAKAWDFSNAKYFVGDITKSKVRNGLLMSVADKTMKVDNGVMVFNNATSVSKKGIPSDGYLAFKVNKPGSVYLIPTDVVGEDGHYVRGNHIIVSVGNEAGTVNSVKGGAAMNVDMTTSQKIIINDITEETMVYVYASGNIGLAGLAWAFDTEQVNTALNTPEPTADPESVTAGASSDITISWPAVKNAASYSLVFNGKTYQIADGETSYVIGSDVVKFLDAGGYMISVYANPGDDDIYNTQSSAGKVSLTILSSGGGSGSFVASSAEDLINAIAAGKQDITLAYSSEPYELGTLTLTAPLHLSGETVEGAYTPVRGNFNISGNIDGCIVIRNLDLDGTNAAGAVLVEGAVTTADTVAIFDSYIHDYSKALYDNSKKYASNIKNLVFKGIRVNNCSNSADYIDMRGGTYNNISICDNTFAKSARTFIRIDAAVVCDAINIANNTFYNLCSVDSKDNNGIFHVRSTSLPAEAFIVEKNIFATMHRAVEAPSNANGYPKIVSTNTAGRDPVFKGNLYYDFDITEGFSWWSRIDEATATANGGAVLTETPFAGTPAAGDFTVKSAYKGYGDIRW